MADPVRVLVCDDSPLLRRVLRDLLTDGGLDVVGEARDGVELIAKVEELSPDVVTLDVEMPRRDGLAGLRELMRVRPTPVVMVSTLTGAGSTASVAALTAGAVDVVEKPALRLDPAGWGATRDELVAKVSAAARARTGALARTPRAARPGAALATRSGSGGRLVVIATSTGGPRALQAVIPHLPSPLGAGVLVVQHMPPGFIASLAQRLDAVSRLTVREARDGDEIRPDRVLIAPGGHHLEVSSAGRVRLSGAPPIGALRPRADITLSAAARHYGRDLVVAVLTGMGDDGTAGARDVRAAGGTVIAEDESTCVVWGMPRSVVAAGLQEAVVPLDAMPLAIAEAVAAPSGALRRAG
ncbi:MAG: chemotaxis-specific protein-glutamate methyltransferase CheB [Thermoleophilia bacterium]